MSGFRRTTEAQSSTGQKTAEMDAVVMIGAVAMAAIAGVWLAADSGSMGLRRTDTGTVLAALVVIVLPLLHLAMAIAGYTANPRHFVGDYFATQRSLAIASIVVSQLAAVTIIGCALIGWLGRRRSPAALSIAVVLVVVALTFAGFELQLWVPEVVRLAPLVGTVPM